MGVGNIPEVSVPDPATQRRRQKLYLVLGILGLIGVAWALVAMQNRDGTRDMTREEVKSDFSASGRQLSDREVWMAKSEQQIQEMKTESDDLRRQIETLRQQLEAQMRQREETVAPPPPPLPPLASPGANRDAMLVPPGNLPPAPGKSGKTVQEGFRDVLELDLEGSGNKQQQRERGEGQDVAAVGSLRPENEIFRIEIERPKEDTTATQDKQQKPVDKEDKEGHRYETYIPAGSFVRGVLLGGVDAPASNQAQSNPHPVLIRVKDLARLPNRFRSDVRECFVVGAAYGDISSERAYIRTETLSCVRKDGQVIEAKVSGYVSGEDGKTGMRGRLVTKQGQLIARALLAGTLSGVGKGIAESYKTTSVSPLGTTTTTDPNRVIESGIATGASNAFDRLAKYYIDMAEKTFPIIEIDANREVEIVFTRGITLELVLKNARARD